jgi:hypothetical protein
MNIKELRSLIRELIKTELEEANVTGTGTSISTGVSGAYATPFAFKKKGKKPKNRGLEQSKRLGYIPVKK